MEQNLQGRWEWRTFGPGFEKAERQIQTHPLRNLLNTHETDILSRMWDTTVKIHFNMLDVKAIQGMNSYGLQQWLPIMKQEFPLDHQMLNKFFELCYVPEPMYGRETYNSEQFLKELVMPNELLRCVTVKKHRQIYRIDDVAVEIATVEFEGVQHKTIGIEHDDPHKVWDLVQRFGLQDKPNTPQVRVMKRCLGMVWMPQLAQIH